MKSLSEELTEVITPLLVDEGLLLPDDAKRYKEKIATGGMRPEDWLLAVEKAIDKEHSQ